MDWGRLPGEIIARSLVNESSDPRVGSSRENSTGGTLSSNASKSSSASSLGSTFIPVLIFVGVCFLIFFVFRRKCPRVYAPRTIPGIRNDDELTPALPDGWFNWIVPFYQIPDSFILNHCSLDGFFFLRYLRVLATICFTGCIIAWPVLLSVNATGGNGQIQLDLLTIGNVSFPIRFYAHVFIAYLFFGFILFMICRECIYYVNMRQAYLLAPQHAHRLSARTVLFTCVPKRFLDEHRIRKLYGDSVKNVWIPTNTKDLERLVAERESTAERLEQAEIELVKRANEARKKALGEKALPMFSHGPLSWPRLRRRGTTSGASIASVSSSSSSSATSSASSSSSSSSAPSISPPSPSTVRTAAAPPDQLSPVMSNVSEPLPVLLKEATVHEEAIIPIDRHASGSDVSSPSATATITVPMFAAFSDVCDKLDDGKDQDSPILIAGMDTQEADDQGKKNAKKEKKKDKKDKKGKKDKEDAEVDDFDDDEENEEDYVHPYGYADTLPDVRGSVAAQWLPAEKRPKHRPLANYGRQVDTIRWTRSRLKELNKKIARLRRRLRAGDGDPISALFVEFDTQAAAQVALQVLAHHQPLHMSPRFIGIRPADLIWSSLRMKWWERIIRRFAIMGAVAAAIIFWSIPSAFVGVASNIDFLSSKIFFLKWISLLPSVVTGVIQGLLPSLALSLLMSIVPSLLRWAARTAGVTSAPLVELFVQHTYFIFQIVQVFLVTTLTSAASAALTKLLENPLSIKDVLSEDLPKASNFYLSYILVQCLAVSASGLVHILDLFRHGLLAKTIQNPRRAFKLYHRLKTPHWGSIFPVYTNLGVIAISYTCIAPLILVFAGVGMTFAYQIYRYNLLFYYDVDMDTKGLHYPRALMHLMVGLYLAQICLIGLFSIQSAIGPVVMMGGFTIFTIIVHLSLNDAVSPMLTSLPRTLALEDKDLAGRDETDALAAAAANAAPREENAAGLAADYYDIEEGFGDDESDDGLHDGPVTTRNIDGASDLYHIFTDFTRSAIKQRLMAGTKEIKDDAQTSSIGQYIPWFGKPKRDDDDSIAEKALDGTEATTGADGTGTGADAGGSAAAAADAAVAAPKKRANFFLRWLHPEIYEDYSYLRKMMPVDPPEYEYPPNYALCGYWPPEMWKPMPRIWIPRDEARVSRQEVAHTRLVAPTTDRGCRLTPKGAVEADLNKAPFREPRIMY